MTTTRKSVAAVWLFLLAVLLMGTSLLSCSSDRSERMEANQTTNQSNEAVADSPEPIREEYPDSDRTTGQPEESVSESPWPVKEQPITIAEIAGDYELLLRYDPDEGEDLLANRSDFTLKLSIGTEGVYTLEEIEDGQSQGLVEGGIRTEEHHLVFSDFMRPGFEMVFVARVRDGLLTVRSVEERKMDTGERFREESGYRWTFRKKP